MPAEPAYTKLLEVRGDRVEAVPKDLEVYSGDQPPPDYSLGIEVHGLLREADERGFDRFHLVVVERDPPDFLDPAGRGSAPGWRSGSELGIGFGTFHVRKLAGHFPAAFRGWGRPHG
jgi:hypothetical protein